MEWVEGFGNSVKEATEFALEGLGVHEDDAEIEILNDVKVGLFNRVKEKARVRARVRPATPRTKDDRRRRRGRGANGGGQGSSQKKRSGSGRGQSESKAGGGKSGQKKGGSNGGGKAQEQGSSKPARGSGGSAKNPNRKQDGGHEAARKSKDENMETMTLSEQADIAEAFVTGLAAEFGEAVTFERTEVDETEIRIVVEGENLGRMIGRRGSTANAIDELVRTVLQRQAGGGRDGRIRVDIGGVAARREAALREFCLKIAQQVRDSGKEIALEPMRGSDRKVVHDAMSMEEGVGTISEGEDPSRRVVVVPAGSDD